MRDVKPEDFNGKTIKKVDVKGVDWIVFEFTDNTRLMLEARPTAIGIGIARIGVED